MLHKVPFSLYKSFTKFMNYLVSPPLKSVFDNQSICYIKHINDYQQVASKLLC